MDVSPKIFPEVVINLYRLFVSVKWVQWPAGVVVLAIGVYVVRQGEFVKEDIARLRETVRIAACRGRVRVQHTGIGAAVVRRGGRRRDNSERGPPCIRVLHFAGHAQRPTVIANNHRVTVLIISHSRRAEWAACGIGRGEKFREIPISHSLRRNDSQFCARVGDLSLQFCAEPEEHLVIVLVEIGVRQADRPADIEPGVVEFAPGPGNPGMIVRPVVRVEVGVANVPIGLTVDCRAAGL